MILPWNILQVTKMNNQYLKSVQAKPFLCLLLFHTAQVLRLNDT